jgi:hypothetical protein
MNTQPLSESPSTAAFEASLTPQRVLTLQMIVMALLTGVILFLAVAFFLNMDNEQVLIGEGKELTVLVGACIAIGCIMTHLALSKFGPAIIRSTTSSTSVTPEDQAFMHIQQLTILRFAPLEGAAMVSLVFYFIGAGTINLIWLVPFFILSYFCFPTRARILATYNSMTGQKQHSHSALRS